MTLLIFCKLLAILIFLLLSAISFGSETPLTAVSKLQAHRQNEKGIKNANEFLLRNIEPTPTLHDPRRTLFFKIQYHPQDPPSNTIQQHWRNIVYTPPGRLSLNQLNCNNSHLDIDRMIVCYKRPPNIGNLLSYRDLTKNGPPVSSFL